MKTASIIAIGVAVVALGFGIYMIDIDQTEEASLPDVNVSVEGGNMPEFDAEVGDIDVGSEEVTMEIPTIDINAPDENESNDS